MRIGKYGKINNKEYRLAMENGDTVELVSKDIKDLDNGFVRYDRFPHIFIKKVSKDSLDYVVKIISYAIIDDEKFEIIGIGDDSVVICTDSEIIAKKYNMTKTGIHEYKRDVSIKGLKVVEEKEFVE